MVGDYEDVEDEVDRLKEQLKEASEVRTSMASVIDRCGARAAAPAAASAPAGSQPLCRAVCRLQACSAPQGLTPCPQTLPPTTALSPLPAAPCRYEAECAGLKRGPTFLGLASLYKDMRIRGIKAEMERLKTWLKSHRKAKDEF